MAARKPPAKRKTFVLRARVTPAVKARCRRVCEARGKDESEWVREGLLAYLDAEEARLKLPALSSDQVEGYLGENLTAGKESPEPAAAWPPTRIPAKSSHAPKQPVYVAKAGSTSSLSETPRSRECAPGEKTRAKS